jgi:cytochrome b
MTEPSPSLAADDYVRVWDVPVRVVHWAIVLLLALSWYSAENELMDWHRYFGFATMGLLLFRIIWGFIGSSTARFAEFMKGPKAIRDYAVSLRRRAPGAGIGHNPIGALSVLLLLLVMLFQVVTGLFAVDIDGIESGPLSDRVSFDAGRWSAELHKASFTLLQVMVTVHILAVLFYLFYKRDNLIGPMITGRRRGEGSGLAGVPLRNFLVAFVTSCLAAWFISKGLQFR